MATRSLSPQACSTHAAPGSTVKARSTTGPCTPQCATAAHLTPLSPHTAPPPPPCHRYVAGGLSREEVKAIARPEPVEDSRAARRRGWARMALLVLYFGPSNLLQPDASFAAISNKLFVGPVVETLVYSKVPQAVTDWVDSICADWSFSRIIPCHFGAPVKAGPAEFTRAFAFAYQAIGKDGAQEQEQQRSQKGGLFGLFNLGSLGGKAKGKGSAPMTRPVTFPPEDLKTLVSLNNALLKTGAVKANADA